MSILSVRHFKVLLLLFSVLLAGKSQDSPGSLEKDGTLVVLVTSGDLDHTPATNVYIEAHGFVDKYHSQKSFVLQISQPGRYEASLPPAVYDVFVSEGTSEPQCKRIPVRPGLTSDWTVQLKIDEVYIDKSR